MDLLTAFLLLLVCCIGGCLFVNWHQTYWKRHGVDYIEPEFFWGNTKQFLKRELSLGDQFTKFYKEFKSRGKVGGGVYFTLKANFVPVDIELIKNILQKDFNHFVNHGLYYNEADDPLSAHLFNLEDDKWKYLRAKLTPSFTSGKLKMMFHTMEACTNELTNILTDYSVIQDPVDIKEVVSRFTTDIIGSCAFGIECNSLKNPQSEFRIYGKKIFDPDLMDKIRNTIILIGPKKLMNALHLKQTNANVEKFFMNAVKETVEFREKNNIHRQDFIHLLLQLKNRGQLTDDDNLQIKKSEGEDVNSDGRLTMNEMAAQCFVFYLAGFETSATTMTFALLELAMNQNIQDKLRNEIHTVLKKYDGNITYDAIMEMTYLNMVVNETLRKHPPFPGLPRTCNKEYHIPGTNITLERNIGIHIPVQAIHRDPEFYPEPDKFDPERFTEENKAKRHPYTFLPFGEGPRICIGARFGLLQTKVGIIAIINNFSVSLNEKTKTPIKYNTKNIVSVIEGDLWLNVSKLD